MNKKLHEERTYLDMFEVLSELVWASNDLPLGDPLLDVVNLPVELEEFGGFL